eukprot:13600870-Heterocapsa_arctica.AAC.1
MIQGMASMFRCTAHPASLAAFAPPVPTPGLKYPEHTATCWTFRGHTSPVRSSISCPSSSHP